MKEIQQKIGLTDALNRIDRTDSSDDDKIDAEKNYVEIVEGKK